MMTQRACSLPPPLSRPLLQSSSRLTTVPIAASTQLQHQHRQLTIFNETLQNWKCLSNANVVSFETAQIGPHFVIPWLILLYRD